MEKELSHTYDREQQGFLPRKELSDASCPEKRKHKETRKNVKRCGNHP